jgi:hypothetical protein
MNFSKLILNILIAIGEMVIIWGGIKIYTHQWNTTNGILILSGVLALIILFVWYNTKHYRWQKPGLFATTVVVLFIVIILSFVGCQPFSNIKDDIWNTIQSKLTTSDINPMPTQNTSTPTITIKTVSSNPLKRLKETIIIPNELTLREDGIYFNPNTKEIIDSDKAIQMIYDWQISEPERNRQYLISTNDKEEQKLLKIGQDVVSIVNEIRSKQGINPLTWDDKLYTYSKEHSIAMAQRKELFHTDINESYGENAWGGEGSHNWTAQTMVDSWINSPKHRTWLLCPNLKHIAVGVAYSNNGMYASWTFWRGETTQDDWWYQYTPDTPPKWWYLSK